MKSIDKSKYKGKNYNKKEKNGNLIVGMKGRERGGEREKREREGGEREREGGRRERKRGRKSERVGKRKSNKKLKSW